MTVFVVENSEESLLKNLWIFLKQTATPPPDLLVFLIAYFIPPTSNSSVKTISISADKDFSPLSRNLFFKKRQEVRKQAVTVTIEFQSWPNFDLTDVQILRSEQAAKYDTWVIQEWRNILKPKSKLGH